MLMIGYRLVSEHNETRDPRKVKSANARSELPLNAMRSETGVYIGSAYVRELELRSRSVQLMTSFEAQQATSLEGG